MKVRLWFTSFWRDLHFTRSGEPIPLGRNYALQYFVAGTFVIFLGIVLLFVIGRGGLGIIAFGVAAYLVMAIYRSRI